MWATFLPSTLEGKPLTPRDIDKDFFRQIPVGNIIAELQSLTQAGCFKIEFRLDPGYISHEQTLAAASLVAPGSGRSSPPYRINLGDAYDKVTRREPLTNTDLSRVVSEIPKKLEPWLSFTLSDVSAEHSKKLLVEYIRKFQNDDLTLGGPNDPDSYKSHMNRLFGTLAKLHSRYDSTPTVTLESMWPAPQNRNPVHTRFWEVIAGAHLVGWVKILNLGYGGTYLVESGRTRYSPQLPFAKLRLLQPSINAIKPIQSSQPKAGLRATVTLNEKNQLVISIGNYKLTRKKRLAPGRTPLKAAKKLIGKPGVAVTKSELNIPGKRRMSDIAQEIGFSGLLLEKLLDASIDHLALKNILLTEVEAQAILAECQDKFDVEQQVVDK